MTTFGQCSAKLAVPGLRREYSITVIAAKPRPILGADFITKYGFQLDMKRHLLQDPLTNIYASLTALTHPDIILRVSVASNSSNLLNRNYPELLAAPDYRITPNRGLSRNRNTWPTTLLQTSTFIYTKVCVSEKSIRYAFETQHHSTIMQSLGITTLSSSQSRRLMETMRRLQKNKRSHSSRPISCPKSANVSPANGRHDNF